MNVMMEMWLDYWMISKLYIFNIDIISIHNDESLFKYQRNLDVRSKAKLFQHAFQFIRKSYQGKSHVHTNLASPILSKNGQGLPSER